MAFYDGQEELAIKEFFASALYEKLRDPETGLWHLGAKALAEIYLGEARGEALEFPEEQS
ncbi:MAG: hypothetical protein FWF96_00300 [Kiritimatiellaeota bacterium]|nr:hypothetical protein [Kiritimatiellota bacterium]